MNPDWTSVDHICSCVLVGTGYIRRDDGQRRVWVERPGALVAWIDAQKQAHPDFDLGAGKTKWYTDDAGRSTLGDILALLEQ